MLWLACYNPEIDWKIGEVKMTRFPEECGRQWRLKQRKPGWQKQKKEEVREEARKKKEKTIEVKRVAEEWKNMGQRRRSSKVGGRG